MNNHVKRILLQLCEDSGLSDAIIKIVADLGLGKIGTEFYPAGDSSEIVSSDFIDCRIRSIEFSDFRLFPKLDNECFGLSFIKGSRPASCIFIGANGTGKSSIFSALEYAYTGHSSHKEEACGADSFLNYAFSDKGHSSLTIDLCSLESKKVIDLSTNSTMDFPLSSFCSEYDIVYLSKEQELAKYVLEQTGYKDLWTIKNEIEQRIINLRKSQIPENSISSKRIREVLLELKDMSDDKRNEASRLSQSESIDENECNKTHLLFKARWKTLMPLPVESGKQLDPIAGSSSQDIIDGKAANKLLNMYKALYTVASEEGIERLSELVNDIESKTEKDDNEEIANEIDVLSTVQSKINTIIDNLLKEICDEYAFFIEDTLSAFSSSNDKEEFKLSTNDISQISLSIKVEDNKDVFTANPQSYLNTFRFRLYCIILKVSLSIWYMNKTRTVLPIVIDDIFSASDFDNNNRLDHLIYDICSLYKRQINDKCNCHIPLQLIILTHDNQAKYSLDKGINSAKMSGLLTSEIINARIFSTKDVLKHKHKFLKDGFINLYL